jgi:hypothetical protein
MNKEIKPNIGDIVYCDRTIIDKDSNLNHFYGIVTSCINFNCISVHYNLTLFEPVSFKNVKLYGNSFNLTTVVPLSWFQDGSTIIVTGDSR